MGAGPSSSYYVLVFGTDGAKVDWPTRRWRPFPGVVPHRPSRRVLPERLTRDESVTGPGDFRLMGVVWSDPQVGVCRVLPLRKRQKYKNRHILPGETSVVFPSYTWTRLRPSSLRTGSCPHVLRSVEGSQGRGRTKEVRISDPYLWSLLGPTTKTNTHLQR